MKRSIQIKLYYKLYSSSANNRNLIQNKVKVYFDFVNIDFYNKQQIYQILLLCIEKQIIFAKYYKMERFIKNQILYYVLKSE